MLNPLINLSELNQDLGQKCSFAVDVLFFQKFHLSRSIVDLRKYEIHIIRNIVEV